MKTIGSQVKERSESFACCWYPDDGVVAGCGGWDDFTVLDPPGFSSRRTAQTVRSTPGSGRFDEHARSLAASLTVRNRLANDFWSRKPDNNAWTSTQSLTSCRPMHSNPRSLHPTGP